MMRMSTADARSWNNYLSSNQSNRYRTRGSSSCLFWTTSDAQSLHLETYTRSPQSWHFWHFTSQTRRSSVRSPCLSSETRDPRLYNKTWDSESPHVSTIANQMRQSAARGLCLFSV